MHNDPIRAVPKPMPKTKEIRKLSRARAKYAEKVVGQRLGGRRTAMSGAGVNEKGDVKVDTLPTPLFVEVKYQQGVETQSGTSVTIKHEWLEKTFRDAAAARELPLVALRFGQDPETYYITSGKHFEALVAQLHEYYERAMA